LGTEEDGVDEAGRTTEPSVMVVPSDADVDPDRNTVESILDNGGMSSSPIRSGSSGAGKPWSAANTSGSSSNAPDGPDASGGSVAKDAVTDGASQASGNGAMGTADATVSDDAAMRGYAPVPFPADEIRQSKGPSGKPASDTPSADARPAGVSTGDWSASDRRDSDRPGGDRPGGDRPGGERPSSASLGNGMLDTGRQAVRQAMAATNSWIARSMKGDAAPARPASGAASPGAPGAPGPGGADRPPFTPANRRPPSFTPSSPSQPPASSASPTQPGQSSYQPPSAYSGSGASARPSGAPGASGAAAGISGYANSVTNAWQSRSAETKQRKQAIRRSPRRQAQLTLSRVEPWSVMKFSFVISVVAFIILFVAVAVLYSVLSGLGVFTSLQHTVTTITSSQGSAGTNISHWFSASRILGYTGMLGALNIVLITAMSTIGAVVYNLIARTIGGVEVTFRETD
jgi:hypothetical protein